MTGVIPNQHISEMIESGKITASPAVIDAQIQPASLDMRLGTVAYRVRASFLTGLSAKVPDRLAEFVMSRVHLTGCSVFTQGRV